MCNMAYRLQKIERLLFFELDYKVMDVSTKITVNISYITNCADPDIDIQNIIFPICLINHLLQSFFRRVYCKGNARNERKSEE